MRKLLLLMGAVAMTVALSTGCAINRASAIVDPAARLDTLKTVHVRKNAPDGRGVNVAIADSLRKRGLEVTTGPDTPGNVDAVVTYVDKWMWDMTMYLLELTVVVREPKTDYPLATGNSYHTSLTRKSTVEMADEVIGNIYKDQKSK